nr:hypothetical protein [Psychrobacter proteolyticus]
MPEHTFMLMLNGNARRHSLSSESRLMVRGWQMVIFVCLIFR